MRTRGTLNVVLALSLLLVGTSQIAVAQAEDRPTPERPDPIERPERPDPVERPDPPDKPERPLIDRFSFDDNKVNFQIDDTWSVGATGQLGPKQDEVRGTLCLTYRF